MITLTREEAQQVLAALCQSSQPASGYRRNELHLTPKPHFELYNEAIETLRARLSQPESEPVAWTVGGLITDFSRDFSAYKTKTYTRPLYTAPPQREWQGLTDDEYELMAEKRVTNYFFNTLDYAHAIEAKLKEKNT